MIAACLILAVCKSSAEYRPDSQQRKIIGRNIRRPHLLGFAANVQIRGIPFRCRGHGFERMISGADRKIVGHGNTRDIRKIIMLRIRGANDDDGIGIVDRRAAQEPRARKAEHRSVQCDANGQSEDCNRCETGRLAQHALGELEILCE